jgi:hypothetical protein
MILDISIFRAFLAAMRLMLTTYVGDDGRQDIKAGKIRTSCEGVLMTSWGFI